MTAPRSLSSRAPHRTSAPCFPAEPIVEMFADVDTAAHVLNTTPRTIYRWLRIGMSWQIADRVAVALGYHPASIWPEWGRDSAAV